MSNNNKIKANKIKAIDEIISSGIEDQNDLMLLKRKLAKKYQINLLLNSEILAYLNNPKTKDEITLRKILRKRAIRTLSGIAPVAVLTKPYPCPGKCAYCPTEPGVPQSYLSNEPAVMRAIRCKYDPYVQVQDRLRALAANGHEPTKIELIVIGGTWSVLPEKYKYWYIASCFKAANKFHTARITHHPSPITQNNSIVDLRNILLIEQKKNEKAEYKIIGITLETRPDYINDAELLEMRELGCTRVELGAQAIDDKILKLNKRGHGVKEITEATKLLKNYGFKVTYHIMPGLPGSTPARDEIMFGQLFTDERFQPDQIKFYPTIVTKRSLLYRWWKRGKYRPYSEKVLRKLISKCKKLVPVYTRIIRLIRDIPGESIIAGNRVTNLRQIMASEGVECRCIRCREAKELPIADFQMSIERYFASGGEEYFISYESCDKKILYGFCRLRMVLNSMNRKSGFGYPKLDFLSGAIIRELHIYGELVSVGGSNKIQHSGLGKKLMAEAEKIAIEKGNKKIAVIAGVGVRNYYRKLGYRLKNTYMVKTLIK